MKIKSIVRLVLISMLMLAAAPAYSGEAMQIWRCEIEDGTTEKAIKEHAVKWLAAAKKLNGAKDLKASVSFPVAVNATGQIDMLFAIVVPDFESWGKFWDAYGDSEIAEMDSKFGGINCPDSVVWETFVVK
jgi:hypothetical protein